MLYRIPISLLEFCKAFDVVDARHKLLSLIFSATLYGYYDYANFILSDEKLATIIGSNDVLELREALLIQRRLTSDRFNDRLYRWFGLLKNYFRYSHNGWAISQEHLGSRRIGPFWWY